MTIQYDKIAEDYLLGQNKYATVNESEKRIVEKLLPELEGKSVLDIGCAGGDSIKKLELLGATNIYGIDISPSMVAKAKKIVRRPENVYVSGFEHTNFDNDCFDIIFARYSLHYAKDIDAVYKELLRITKPQGHLLFVVHHPIEALLLQKKSTEYGKQEIVSIRIFGKKVKIQMPSHTLKEYFSDFFFDNFNLDAFEEGPSVSDNLDSHVVPDYLVYKATKK
ncbi:MAG: class I SAM-dependent methyltransferase [Aestuariibacter sp.]|nr:class I SAM-dependent methyltransferase [Aestuariibacter sp.]